MFEARFYTTLPANQLNISASRKSRRREASLASELWERLVPTVREPGSHYASLR